MIVEEDWPRFWDWHYANAFRLFFERPEVNRPAAIRKALQSLPAALGNIEYSADFGDERLVVLFTRNLDNDGAILNETTILSILANTKAIVFFGTEGACGAFDFTPYRSLTDPPITQEIAKMFLAEGKIAPVEYLGVTSRQDLVVWGIEDKELYLASIEAMRSGSGKYHALISKRPPLILDNLLEKMEEMAISIAGAWVTPYNFSAIRRLLEQRGISHLGVWAKDCGSTDWGRENRKLRGEWDEREQVEQEIFSGGGILSWLKSITKPRTIHYKMGNGNKARDFSIRRVYWYDKFIERGRKIGQRLGHLFRRARMAARRMKMALSPTPQDFAGLARHLGIQVQEERCDLCGTAFLMPERPIAVPMELQRVLSGSGGRCTSCAQKICEQHVLLLSIRREETFYCLPGCETCGGLLAGSSG